MTGAIRKSGWITSPAALLAGAAGAMVPGAAAVAVLLAGAPGIALTLPLFGIGVMLAVVFMAWYYPHDRPGGGNVVTMLRLAMVTGLAAAAIAPDTGWAVPILALVVLAMDGADGYLARRDGLVSGFGARFDMEVDAALAAVLAIVVMTGGTAGVEVLVLGFTRYVFIGATLIWPWLAAPLHESWRRKAVCVLQIGTLAGLTVPGLPGGIAQACGLFAAVMLLWSFAVDIRSLAQRR